MRVIEPNNNNKQPESPLWFLGLTVLAILAYVLVGSAF